MTTFAGHIVDVLRRRIFEGEIVVREGVIAQIRACTLPGEGAFPYILPGFIDSHVHIESSMILPREFARAAVRHGTIGIVSDPHEIANVLGMEGVRYMIGQARQTPFNILFGAPSCVPCCPPEVETSGARLDVEEVTELLAMKEVGYLSEMMNYVGVLGGDPEVMAKIEAAQKAGKPVDGHAPGLLRLLRQQYAGAGITTDHECSSLEEGYSCVESCMMVMIREGSAARNYQALMPLIEEYPDLVMFCTDDYNPDELLTGHIDRHVRWALARDYTLWNVLQAACVNPQRHYGVNWGLLRPGDPATFILTDSLLPGFNILQTVLKGRVAFPAEGEKPREEAPLPNRFVARPITEEDIRTDVTPGLAQPVIVATDGSLFTRHQKMQVQGEQVQKIVVYNRYQEGAKPVTGFVCGFHMAHGAMASSVAHDCHNIVAVGASDQEIVRAINRVIEMRGGLVAIAGEQTADLPLPIAGLMSPLPVEEVAQRSQALYEVVWKAGCRMAAPFITLSFMCLPVIPELKITDRYLWDSIRMKPVTRP